MPEFDVVFTDTCLGGSTVAARVAESGSGLRAFYLADYAINPLGVKARDEIHAVLERWVRLARSRTDTLVVACNTASVLLAQSPDLLAMAEEMGLRVVTMVDLLDRALASAVVSVAGRRVCLMGTRFTVSQPVYHDALVRAGAAQVLPLAATRTERTVAHLWHTSDEGRRAIADEISETIRRADVVVLACTLFPLVASLVREIHPECELVDPADGISGVLAGCPPGGPREPALPRNPRQSHSSPGMNRLTIALTGTAVALDEVRAQAPSLFPGWDIESIGAYAGPDAV